MTEPRPLCDRTTKEDREARYLAPYALPSSRSLGRRFPEDPDPLRTCFERDRDRITHSTAFRRLMYKTQVFVNSEGDHNRTRMSHSLEVCQVARSVGNSLGLNEPLCEALGLAHDLGHPPFGHRGEWALDELMKGAGGFRHNAQVLRVVDQLERRSPAYPGLNLTREVRESLLKHETDEDWPDEFRPKPRYPALEGQVADMADSTAYNKHDVEDGLLAGMFSEDDIFEEVALWRDSVDEVERHHPHFLAQTEDAKLRIFRIANEMIGACIIDITEASQLRLAASGVDSPEDVKSADRMLIGHSPEMGPRVAELQRFLYKRFYRHEHLQEFRKYAKKVLSGLFHAYEARPDELSTSYREWADEVGLPRAICDYMAGMTDRFAEQEYARLVR